MNYRLSGPQNAVKGSWIGHDRPIHRL